ncbi:hypothetical protein MLD38_014921 [Melastoma candidum]|uniref:Uncharacterized protein n=1 Tax=Melastoma candidum TaxID=119954 RepID=A0ACB9RG85_9MYRT|nr:hypothetical protein MLD38_014921 [Melastoma candidum]
MHNPSTVKERFLKKWITSLRRCSSSSHESTSTPERRRIIKLSADLALASARNGSTRWSRAVINDALQSHDEKGLVQRILGLDGNDSASLIPREETFNKSIATGLTTKKVVVISWSKKILKRSRRVRKFTRRGLRNEAASIAKRLVKKRTQLLKDLVPGGRDMDDVSLIEETLDYMVWLRAQVDVMRSLAHSLPTSQTSK